MEFIALVALVLALLPLLLGLWNLHLYRPPALPADLPPGTRVSVLIPARDEEANIAACVGSVLANGGVELEVVVLDDDSQDRTAEIVGNLARADDRVRLERALPLPPGWCGKQHACHVLAERAR